MIGFGNVVTGDGFYSGTNDCLYPCLGNESGDVYHRIVTSTSSGGLEILSESDVFVGGKLLASVTCYVTVICLTYMKMFSGCSKSNVNQASSP